MVMHAGALDAELGGKVAKAEASISGIADMGLRQAHQSFGSFIHCPLLSLSVDRP
jgi:hypothetical protein